MGWISKRAAAGNPVGGYNPRSPKNGAPMRKIVRRIWIAEDMFDADCVELECGHQARSNGAFKARCVECKGAE